MRSNRPYVQIDPSVIEQARQMDLLSYLQRYEPSTLKRVAGNVYCTKEHDSLKISTASSSERITIKRKMKMRSSPSVRRKKRMRLWKH